MPNVFPLASQSHFRQQTWRRESVVILTPPPSAPEDTEAALLSSAKSSFFCKKKKMSYCNTEYIMLLDIKYYMFNTVKAEW